MEGNFSNMFANLTQPVVPQPPFYLLGVTTFLYIIIFSVGVFGNFAVITVVYRCRAMRTFFNKLFLNLCVADLLVLVITGPTAVIDIYAREIWYLGEIMCKLIPYVENVVGSASAMTILAISIERYRLTYSCKQQHKKSWRPILITSAAIWTPAILSSLPFMVITQYDKRRLLDGTPAMVCNTPIYLPWHKLYIVVITSFFFFIPLIIIIILYAKVCRKLVTLYKQERSRFETSPIEIIQLKRQMIQIIVTVVLVFFVCHTPYRAIVLWTLFEKRENLRNFGFDAYLIVLYLTRILLFANHAINPFVYNFVSRKFRRALVWICCHKRRRLKKNEEDNHNHLPLRRLSKQPDVIHPGSCSVNREDRNHRNDFLALYKNLVLLEY
ncbi:trissin receptor [Patella vulgata]|uniref:trissin receptor n=1 Tax=Patella vulgata TaxID=6465 RepID=UPI00217F90A2|nr:trissin receptor [Patella vulgata]